MTVKNRAKFITVLTMGMAILAFIMACCSAQPQFVPV